MYNEMQKDEPRPDLSSRAWTQIKWNKYNKNK